MRPLLFFCVALTLAPGSHSSTACTPGAFQENAPEPARDDVRETLKTFVLLQLKDGGGELTVPYKTEAGRTITAKVLSGTEDELKLSSEGKAFSATWE